MSGTGLPYQPEQPRIADPCPSCGGSTLFIGAGGWLTCSVIGCQHPAMFDAISAHDARIRADERDRCAKVCDELENDRIACADELPKPPHISTRTHDEAEKELHEHAHCFRVAAAAIRAMKEGA